MRREEYITALDIARIGGETDRIWRQVDDDLSNQSPALYQFKVAERR